MDKKKILVIGGGFGGVFAAKTLERQGGRASPHHKSSAMDHALPTDKGSATALPCASPQA